MTGASAWPDLDYGALAPTRDYLNRLVQVAGKYTLDELFETGWGNIVLDVTPRGLRTPTLRQGDTSFQVEYRLLDGEVELESDRGSRSVPLRTGSVATFHEQFCAAASSLGLHQPGSTLLCELPSGYGRFELDTAVREWDPQAARLIWSGFDLVAAGLRRFQAPFRGHRPRTGVMWGGFDLSSTRYRGVRVAAPADRPVFLQQGMTEEYVSVGFSYGSPTSPQVGLYAYVAPEPKGMEGRSWGVPGAGWDVEHRVVQLAWADLLRTPDPLAAIVTFGDAVYAAAVQLAGWPADLVDRRQSGWTASTTPPSLPSEPSDAAL